MTLVVPFDGSELAEAALVRATEFGNVLEEEVLAVSVVRNGNAEYAREHDWIGPNEEFDLETVVSSLHEQVIDLCPASDFRHTVVDRYAPAGSVAKAIRKMAKREDASMAFIGSENAGHLVTSISSVGGSIASDDAYDVVIVRNCNPSKIAKLRDTSPHRRSKSDFYFPE
ncbi:universal stress protein [Haloarcula sp. Atlit-7R]|uniref:universal stress protein n=1 Tax=Haloarcula sp. Atlit-7R TaxID=2282125 RepID=UPI000EF1355A|nr:universal stress protein [Haloarcula sp. Atlit-7R]RLM94964.1 universal stress protein [Haloarcula sp. Atlit-7R]